jgi:DNA-binding transcriptional ArsR family regulator
MTLSEIDLELLRFLAEHRFALADHAAALLGVTRRTAGERLARLVDGGYVREASVPGRQPAMYLIKRSGLAAVGSALPAPLLKTLNYEHDVGLAWLWLAAQRGTFGPLSEILSERTLRSRDGARARSAGLGGCEEPLGVRKGGVGPRGGEQLHYPDLLLRTTDGRCVAVELELSGKARTRLESILAAYAADPRIAGVVYLVQNQTVARSVERAARRVGASELVRLQRVRLAAPGSAGARGIQAERATTPRRRHAPPRQRGGSPQRDGPEMAP